MADTIQMPKLGFDMAEGTLVRWVKVVGETVAKGDVLAEIETDKATVEVESAFSGVVARHLIEEGAIVPVGTPIAIIGQPGEEVPADEQGADTEAAPQTEGQPEPKAEAASARTEAETPAQPAETAPAAPVTGGRVIASPLARKLAEERGIDLAAITGSGPGGRIVKQDVENAKASVAQPAATPVATAEVKAAPSKRTSDERVPLSKLRSIIGKRMVESRTTIPHFYVTHAVDMGPLLALRKQVNGLLDESQKLSVNDFVVKAVGMALAAYPNLNASLDGDAIVRHAAINVGVAVAVEGGLLTVVSRDTDTTALRTIAENMKAMVDRAREGKVKPDDIEGSTFSISNLGMYDVEHFVAIINAPEAAILAVGSAKEVPVVVEGKLEVGIRMNMTLSADHRVTDGAEAAQFLQVVAEKLENPLGLLL